MGFWKSFFGLEDNNSNQTRGKKSELDTTFVSYSEEREFEESIYGTLQLYDAEVSYIEEVLPERGANLKKQIDLLLQLLEKTNNEDDPEVRKVFKELRTQFEEDKRLADGEYTISELEHQNRIMDSAFEKTPWNGGVDREKLNEYVDFISKVQRKVKDREEQGTPILTKVQRQKFNVVSMRSEYRIKMLELMYLVSNSRDLETNPFLGLSETKQKMFSKMFFEDAKFAAQQYEALSYYEDAYNMYKPSFFRAIDDMSKNLNAQLANAKMIDDFSIRQIFDSERDDSKSFDFLKRFVRFKSTINDMMSVKETVIANKAKKDAEEKAKEEAERAEQERIEAEKAEQERIERETLEKYKNFTDEDIKREIDRIEHDISAKGSRYVNILDFQKKVARAKGLLETEERLKKDGLVCKAVDAVNAAKIVQVANMTGISYAAFPDCQEYSNGGFTFVVPKSDSKVLEIKQSRVPYTNQIYSFYSEESLGTFPDFVLTRLEEELGEGYDKILYARIVQNENNSVYQLLSGYSRNTQKPSNYKTKVEAVKKKLEELRTQMDDYCADSIMLQDVMCYISVPATRNIIPILQEFKKANISSYLEPVPQAKSARNGNNRNNIQIYFERDDLEKFKFEVLSRISSTEQGLVGVRWDDKSIGTAIKEEVNWKAPAEREIDE